MSDIRIPGQTSNMVRLNLGVTGLAYNTSGLIVSVITSFTNTATVYTGGNLEDVTGTIGSYQTPSTGKCRFAEVDATNHPGLYEIHFLDTVFAGTFNANHYIDICVSGASGLPTTGVHYRVQLAPSVNTHFFKGITAADPNGSGYLPVNVQYIQEDYASATALVNLFKSLDIITSTSNGTKNTTTCQFTSANHSGSQEKAFLNKVMMSLGHSSSLNNKGVAVKITGYSWDGVNSEHILTFDQLPAAPYNDDSGEQFIVVGLGS